MSSSAEPQLEVRKSREIIFVVLSAVLAAISFALLWYQAYGLNQSIQLAYVNHWTDPSLYPNDPFLATSRYYITFFWKAVALLTAFVPLRSILLGGMFLERWLAIYAASRIARSLAGASTLARICAMSIMTAGPIPLLGAGTTMPDYFEQSGVTMALLLLGMSLFLDRNYLLWGLLVGLSANLNALYCAFAVGYCAVIFVAERRPIRDLRRLAGAFGFMVFCALPILFYLYRLPGQLPFDHHAWWDAMKTRSPHHLMPRTWPMPRYVEFGITIVLLVAVGWYERANPASTGQSTRPSTAKLARFSVAIAIAMVAALAAAFFVAYGVHIPSLLVLQPIRGTDLGYCLTDIAFACGAAIWFQRSAADAKIALMLLPVVLLSCLWSLLPVAALGFAVISGIGAYLLSVFVSKAITPAARIRIATQACLVSLFVAAVARPALTRQYTMFNTGNRWPVSGAAQWAAGHTPKDDIFLVNPIDDRTEPFRALSRRSVYVHAKDGTSLFYDPDYLDIWQKRMQIADGLLGSSWNDADAMELHRTAGINHWLVSHDWPTALPVVWQDKTFKILDLSPGDNRSK